MPFPYSQAVLSYVDDVQPGTFITPADLAASMQACQLDTADISMVATLVTDVTTVTPTGAQRTLTFALGQEFNATLQPIPPPSTGEEGSSLTIGQPPFVSIDGKCANQIVDPPRCCNPGCNICGTTPCPGPNEPNPPLASASGPFQDLFTFTLRKCLASQTLHQLPPIVT
jgi:hypothetical protein